MERNLKALVVDDEEKICLFLAETLKRAGFNVSTATSGEAALALLQDTYYPLTILDLKLNGRVDGQRILEAIRWRWPATVVLILTAHGSLESAMAAIHEGVDGYLLKPIRPEALRQAVEDAFLRRRTLIGSAPGKDANRKVQGGPFVFDLNRHTVTRDGELLHLSISDYDLLLHLVQNAPKVIDPKELVRVVAHYEPDTKAEAQETIKWYIHRLRRKVEPDPLNPRYILNVRGVGYRMAD